MKPYSNQVLNSVSCCLGTRYAEPWKCSSFGSTAQTQSMLGYKQKWSWLTSLFVSWKCWSTLRPSAPGSSSRTSVSFLQSTEAHLMFGHLTVWYSWVWHSLVWYSLVRFTVVQSSQVQSTLIQFTPVGFSLVHSSIFYTITTCSLWWSMETQTSLNQAGFPSTKVMRWSIIGWKHITSHHTILQYNTPYYTTSHHTTSHHTTTYHTLYRL